MTGTEALDQGEPMQTDPSGVTQKAGGQSSVQSYLVSRYREALKTGDKSFAKSCLLSTRLFSLNDPGITNELYVMAKADGDISEAAKCLSIIFDELYPENLYHESLSSEAQVVANFMKEELRLLLTELKNQYLRLRSIPLTSAGGHARPAPSVSQSPLLSPRLRMSSEDRSMSRDSMLRLDTHLKTSNKSLFYQQLYEHLGNDARLRILDHAIESCDNPFERCRLMMLALTIFRGVLLTYNHQLIKILVDLTHPTNEKSVSAFTRAIVSRPPSMRLYARSMLALDAIPLVFSLSESQPWKVNFDQLFQLIINYYSEIYLDGVAQEYEFEELHEGLKKTIAARILGKNIDGSNQDETVEESLNLSLNLVSEKFLQNLSNDTTGSESLTKLRSLVSEKGTRDSSSFDAIQAIISNIGIEDDIPENILFSSINVKLAVSQGSAATPPPKARGRPKKSQASVIVSPNDGVQRHLENSAKEALFVYTLIMQYMFNNCSKYLKQTRTRILMRFDNPLAAQVETELTKVPAPRASRGRNTAHDSSVISPSKKVKIEAQSADENPAVANNSDLSTELNDDSFVEPSPLNSDQSLMMDKEILETLKRIHQCIEFLTSCPTYNRLYTRYLSTNNCDSLRWYLKIRADCMLQADDFESALNSLDKINKINRDGLKIKEERSELSELSTLTVATGPSAPVEVIHLRALAQSVTCRVQLLDKKGTLSVISKLLDRVKQSGLLNNDENYATGNVIDEYRILVPNDARRKEGFLFFDGLSLVRYVTGVLTDILKRYVVHATPNSDSLVGHAIVLSQVDWPKEVALYERCISWIRANKPTSTTPQCLSALTKFTYPDFFNYILDPSILEDFMALLNDGFTLDIKGSNGPASLNSSSGATNDQALNSSMSSSRSSGGSARSGKAITTRGVNKSFKDDLKVALIAQMKSSTTLIPLDLIAEFIQTSLVSSLMATTK